MHHPCSKGLASIYVGFALEIVQENEELGLSEFNNCVFERVSRELQLSVENMKYFYNAFHWGLFLKNYSPLELVSFGKGEETYKVELRENLPEKSDLIMDILDDYEGWFVARMKKIREKGD